MTIDLARIKEIASNPIILLNGGVLVPPSQLKALVAVVEAALRMQAASVGILDHDEIASGLEFYEADKALTASLQPFTNGGAANG